MLVYEHQKAVCSISVQNCSVYVHLLPLTFKALLSCGVVPDFMEFVN